MDSEDESAFDAVAALLVAPGPPPPEEGAPDALGAEFDMAVALLGEPGDGRTGPPPGFQQRSAAFMQLARTVKETKRLKEENASLKERVAVMNSRCHLQS